MTLIFDKYQLKTDRYGWLLQKKVGNQWKETLFYTKLEHAISSLIDQITHEKTSGINIDLTNQTEALRMIKELNVTLAMIKTEIVEVLNV